MAKQHFQETSILFNNSFFQSNLTSCQLPNTINIDIKKNTKIENKSLTATNIITTLGSNGANYKEEHFPVEEVDVRDTSGAGDSFVAGFVYSYLHNANVKYAIGIANECATQVVQKKGTAKINLDEI